MVRSGRRSSGRKAECDSPTKAKQRRWKIPTRAPQAKSRRAPRAQGSKAGFGSKPEAEPPGRAARMVQLARRNTPCRKGRRRVRRARHRPPALGQGRTPSTPATGCKQWPASFSRFEYHPAKRKKLNGYWLLLVNFWCPSGFGLPCRPREFSPQIWPGPCRNPFCSPSSTV